MSKTNLKLVELSAINTRVRFEQWASNPECGANTVSAVLNVPMGTVAEKLGYQGNKGMSPFAIQRGNLFERDLFYNSAERLRSGLEMAQVLTANTKGFKDFRLPVHGGSEIKTRDEAVRESELFLKKLAAGNLTDVPSITTGLTLKLAKGVMLPEATLILDVMTIHPGEHSIWILRVGEIKIFPDRGGHTDPQHLASARAQAGVYKHALEEWIAIQKLDDVLSVSNKGFLVFTWPGSNWPVIRGNEDLFEQAQRAKRGFTQLDFVAQRVVGQEIEDFKPEAYSDWVARSETSYKEACWTFCDLAPRCQDNAIAKNKGIVLGNETARLLGLVTTTRALALLSGQKPETAFEETLVMQLQAANWG